VNHDDNAIQCKAAPSLYSLELHMHIIFFPSEKLSRKRVLLLSEHYSHVRLCEAIMRIKSLLIASWCNTYPLKQLCFLL